MKQPKCGSEVKAKLQPAGPTSRVRRELARREASSAPEWWNW